MDPNMNLESENPVNALRYDAYSNAQVFIFGSRPASALNMQYI